MTENEFEVTVSVHLNGSSRGDRLSIIQTTLHDIENFTQVDELMYAVRKAVLSVSSLRK